MSQMKLHRFDATHLHDFRMPRPAQAAALEAIAQEEAAPIAPVYAEADLDHARASAKKLGYAEGFEAGLAQAATETAATARDTAHHLERINVQLAELAGRYQALVNEQAGELNELVLLIARKLAGEALAAHGAEHLQAWLLRCLPVFFTRPRVTIELSPTMIGPMQEQLQASLQHAGYEGDVQFRTATAMDTHDIRIDWQHGQAARSTAALWQEIEALLASVSLSPTLPELPTLNETNI